MKILDPCCGSKMFYYEKDCPIVTFGDIRELDTHLCDGRSLCIKPDIFLDVTNLEFPSGEFDVVIFDPPHLINTGDNSWLKLKYGRLDKKEYKQWLQKGFAECFRVLKQDGVLIFKWNEEQVPFSVTIEQAEYKPLLGDKRGNTRWTVFIKNQALAKAKY